MNEWLRGKHHPILPCCRLRGLCHPGKLSSGFPQCDTSLSLCPFTTVCLLVIEALGLFRRKITAMPVFCTHCDHLQINLSGNIIFLLYGVQFWLLSCPQSACFHTNSYDEKLRCIPSSPKWNKHMTVGHRQIEKSLIQRTSLFEFNWRGETQSRAWMLTWNCKGYFHPSLTLNSSL